MNRLRWWLPTGAFMIAACSPEPAPVMAPPDTRAPTQAAADVAPGPYFVDIAQEAGLVFEHFAGITDDYYFPEIMGSGVALFDFDADGDLDVYALQGAMLAPGKTPADARIRPRQVGPLTNRLYRNQFIPDGELRFVDVTQGSGLGDSGYAMGVVTGDTDNDGDVDVVVTNFGQNRLFENLGAGHFAVVDGALAVAQEEEWTTSASFSDIDGDGDLDLFTTNYVGFTVANNIRCRGANGVREYCSPNTFPPTVDRLWRNDSDNRFADISVPSRIASAAGNGLGTIATDFDGDGDIDLYVANDMMENRLWTQGAGGLFADTALMAGTAYNASGAAEASMGVTAGDFDGDGDDDLFMTHLASETNTLYLNDGDGNFFDITDGANLAASSVRLTGFGTGWIDFDNDGRLDLFIANGAVTAVDDPMADPALPYGQVNQLLHNVGGRFVDVSPRAGENFTLREISRGAAFGDLDNDGDMDIVVSNVSGPLRLLRNEVGNRNDWLRVRLRARDGKHDGAGARVAVTLSDGRVLWRRAHTDGSYLSASDIRVLFGLGTQAVSALRVIWPSGLDEIFPPPASNQQITLTEGAGEGR